MAVTTYCHSQTTRSHEGIDFNSGTPIKPSGISFGLEKLYSHFISQIFKSTKLMKSYKTVPSHKTSAKQLIFVISLLLAGDIQSNPGPVKFPCTTCNKNIRSNSKAIECDVCLQWTHVKCQYSITTKQYDRICKNDDDFEFLCNRCACSELPFCSTDFHEQLSDVRNEELLTSEETMETDRPDLKNFKTEKGLHFIHLNVRSLLPKIDQIRHIHMIVEDTKCSIIGVTESWLDSTVPDPEINPIPGYTVIRKDRNCQGGGV